MTEVETYWDVSIVKTPNVCGGKARIDGKRITAYHIGTRIEGGSDPKDVAAKFDHVSVEEVKAAYKYYCEHSEEMDQIEKRRDDLEELLSAKVYVCSCGSEFDTPAEFMQHSDGDDAHVIAETHSEPYVVYCSCGESFESREDGFVHLREYDSHRIEDVEKQDTTSKSYVEEF